MHAEALESIASGSASPLNAFLPSIELREFVSAGCGSRGISTGTATFHPGAELPYHTHPFSEAITILEGIALVVAGDRCYRLTPYDNLHVPAGLPHKVINDSSLPVIAHWAFASESPVRHLSPDITDFEYRGFGLPHPEDPESLVRFADCEVYELSPGAHFRDLFGSRFGAVGICGGYGLFEPGSSLPCHVHQYDESITIVRGEAVCMVQGNRYRLRGYDTAFVPEGRPHRFLNHSDQPMAMVWVYAGGEPERTIVEAAYCEGVLAWPGIAQAE